MRGECPAQCQHQSKQSAGQPVSGRDACKQARSTARRRQDGEAQRHAHEQPGPQARRNAHRFRCLPLRQQFDVLCHQRAAIGAFRFAQVVGQASRQEGLLPAGQRAVGERSQAQVEADPHPRGRRGQPHRFAAIGVATGTHLELPPQLTAKRAVDGVAHAGGAVVGVVVVAVARVLGPGVLRQRGGQRLRLRGVEVQPLQARAATDLAVVAEVLFQRQRDQHVFHLAAHEAADEAVLGQVEEAEVVAGRPAGRAVVDHDGVVAEALPEDVTRPHGDYADAGCGLCIGGGGLRVRAAHEESEQQEEPEQSGHAHVPARHSREGGNPATLIFGLFKAGA